MNGFDLVVLRMFCLCGCGWSVCWRCVMISLKGCDFVILCSLSVGGLIVMFVFVCMISLILLLVMILLMF